MKHGGLSSGKEPILTGPFAEDPQEHREKIDLIVASLHPENPLEARMATEIAGLFVCADRIGALEAASYEGDARLTAIQRAHFESADDLAELAGQARGLFYYLAGAADYHHAPFREYANLMRYHGPKKDMNLRRLWDDDHMPETDEQWEKAYRLLLEHLWSSKTEAAVWANSLSESLDREWLARDGKEKEVIAAKSLDGTVDKVTRYQSRVLADLRRLLQLYWDLKGRTQG